MLSGKDSTTLPNVPGGNPNAIPRGIPPPDSSDEGYLYNMMGVGVADAISGGDVKYHQVVDGNEKVSRHKRQSAFSVLNFLLVVFNIILDINNNGK